MRWSVFALREASLGTWALIQLVFDIFVALGLFIVVMRMNRAPKDDPRLSRGLQLLQSKISVLEDLSDRTEVQVNQLTAILEQKAREVQAKVQMAEQHVQMIKVSMENSLEVAKIFQDKIPHQEIIERQNSVKYIQAARLAHQGLSAEEIATKVDLPKGEIEFIAKVNREQLVFSEEQLPWWAKESAHGEAGTTEAPTAVTHPSVEMTQANESDRLKAEMALAEQQRLVENLSRLQSEMQNLDMQLAKETPTRDMATAFEVPQVQTQSLRRLGDEFRKACEAANETNQKNPLFPPLDQLTSFIPQMMNGVDFVPTPPSPNPSLPPTTVVQAASTTAVSAIDEPKDPVSARAVAQAKVQAALRASAPAKPSPGASVELQAARTMAREIAKDGAKDIPKEKPLHLVSESGTASGGAVVRKVEFPKITME